MQNSLTICSTFESNYYLLHSSPDPLILFQLSKLRFLKRQAVLNIYNIQLHFTPHCEVCFIILLHKLPLRRLLNDVPITKLFPSFIVFLTLHKHHSDSVICPTPVYTALPAHGIPFPAVISLWKLTFATYHFMFGSPSFHLHTQSDVIQSISLMSASGLSAYSS